jgi:hypothetical protein
VTRSDRVNSALRFLQGFLGGAIPQSPGLQADQRGHHGQTVRDPMVDLGQQDFGLVTRLDQISTVRSLTRCSSVAFSDCT